MKRHCPKALIAIALMAGALTGAAQDYTPRYQLINKADYPTNDLAVATYNVMDYGADATGQTDCTRLFQTLLDRLAGVGTKSSERGNYQNITGGVLYVPEGRYLISGKLVIPRGVTLRGDWLKPAEGQPVKGTILMLTHGRGSTAETEAAITMQPSTELSNVVCWYPDQRPDAIVAYPPAILYGQQGYWGNEYCNVRHVTLVNAYTGIDFLSTNGGGCPNIFELYGTPLHEGVVMDAIADVGRFDWISFSPAYWESSGLPGAPAKGQIDRYLRLGATGIVMRRNDWSYTCNYQCRGYNTAFRAEASPVDGSKPNGHNYGFDFTDCEVGVKLLGSSYCGILFTRVNTTGCSKGVELVGGGEGPVQLYGCRLGATRSALVIDQGAGSAVMAQQCTFDGPTHILGGEFICDGSTFNADVAVAPIARSIMTGNTFASGVNYDNTSIFDCVMSDRRTVSRDLPEFRREWMEIKTTRPAREALYVVTGITPQAITDNLDNAPDATSAIQSVLDKAGAEGGGIVYLPAGHYRLDGDLTIPTGVELKGASDLATVPKGNGTILECFSGEGRIVGAPFINMQPRSGLRGITVNYPRQTDPAALKNYPYTVRGNADCYIVNLALRAALRGVDLYTNKCDRHYVDYLSGHAFLNVVRVGGGSEDGTISNIQCNTIAYACGWETKFGQWPNCRNLDGSKAYAQNMEDLNFIYIDNCKDEVLYNNFLYGCNQGMVFQKSGGKGVQSPHCLGNAVDGAVNTFVFTGADDEVNLINSQVVALNHQDNIIKRGSDACFITLGPQMTQTVNFFGSDHWGGGSNFAKVNGAGQLNLYLTNMQQSGTVSTFQTSNSAARVSMVNGYVSNVRQLAANADTDLPRLSICSTVIDPGVGTSRFAAYANNLPHSWEMMGSPAFINRAGWTATANNDTNGSTGKARQAIDDNTATRWDTGESQKPGQWFAVDMKQTQRVNTVILDATLSSGDGPAAYNVEVAQGNGAWTRVATGTEGSGMLVVSFPETQASRIRVNQTGTKGGYWSIHEFYAACLSQVTGISQAVADVPQQATSFAIYATNGSRVAAGAISELRQALQSLPGGIYVVVTLRGNQRITIKKIIHEKNG